MNSLLPLVSLKRSRTCSTRKNSISMDTGAVCPPRSSILTRRGARPPPLQIIPELSENGLDIDVSSNHSPVTARPTQSFPPQLELNMSRITLSAYTFSIDHALLMFGDEAPRSPALSASSSTSDGASSEGVLHTPRTSEDENDYDCMLPIPRLCPRRISIRPLCITKTRSFICQEDEDIHDGFEKEEEEVTEEAGQDFYTHEFEDFISLSPIFPSPTCSARRDSLTLAAEALPTVIDVPQPKPRGRSRHSKPLPLLPPTTPPVSSLPSISAFLLAQTAAQKSIVRRKRNVDSLPDYTPPPPFESRPLPRVAIPLDIEDCIFLEESVDTPPRGPTANKQIYDAEDPNTYSRSSFACIASASIHPLPPAIPETPISAMCSQVTLPRSSTDSDAPRSSIDSTLSFASSSSSNTPISPFSFSNSPCPDGPEFESTERLRSRWSSSTLGSVTAESQRPATIFSPLKGVLGSRARRVFLPQPKVPPQTPPHLTSSVLSKNKQGFPRTTSPLGTLGKHLRRQRSRSSTSSGGTSSSECDSNNASPSGLKRKPIPVLMFLRAT